MSIKTIEKTGVNSNNKEFIKILESNPDIRKAIDDLLHDTLVDWGWNPTLLGWNAVFDVTFDNETFEDEE